jgi:hypothetical protein
MFGVHMMLVVQLVGVQLIQLQYASCEQLPAGCLSAWPNGALGWLIAAWLIAHHALVKT